MNIHLWFSINPIGPVSPSESLLKLCWFKWFGFFNSRFFTSGTSNPIIQPQNLILKVLNTLLAPSLIGLGTWFINQSYHLLSLPLTCGRDLLISCRSNISISCGLGFLGLLSSTDPQADICSGGGGMMWRAGDVLAQLWPGGGHILKQSNQLSFSHSRITS